ncbi:MAG: hypothetical protein O6945_06910 [Gammaproteobacteria bacterium]|nr:hypothetical protein [Gammaproteobacteria bacterium]
MVSTDLKDLVLLLDSKVPVLVIESFEEPRVLEMITRLAVKRASPLYAWPITEGLNRLGFGSRPGPDLTPQQLIETIHGTHPLSVVMQEKERCVFAD